MSLVRSLLGLPPRHKFFGGAGQGLSVSDWFNGMTGWSGWGSPSAAGKDVNMDSAMSIAAVFACVKIISETIGSLPLVLMRRRPDGSVEEAVNESLYSLLRYAPNDHDTAMSFMETLSAHGALRGNAYAKQYRSPRGELQRMEILHPDRVMVMWNDGHLFYQVLPLFGQGPIETLVAEEMLHFRLLSADGLIGMSPLTYARNSFGLSLALDETASKLFANGALPGGILTTDAGAPPLDDKTREANKANWQAAHGGSHNAYKVAVLSGGMKWQQVTLNSVDAQFLESRKFQLEEIARIFRVPLHLLGELTRSTNNNIEQQALEFIIHTIRPWLVRWEQILTEALLTRKQRAAGLFLNFREKDLLRGDTKTIAEAHNTYLQNGVLSVNEVRSELERNAIEGGDQHLQPLNMAPIGEKPPEIPAETPPKAGEKSAETPQKPPESSNSRAEKVLSSLLSESLERVNAKKDKAIEHNAAKLKAKDFEVWLRNFCAIELRNYFVLQVEPAARKIIALHTDLEGATASESSALVSRYADRFCRRIPASLSAALEPDDTLNWSKAPAKIAAWLEDERELTVSEFALSLKKRLLKLAHEDKDDAAA